MAHRCRECGSERIAPDVPVTDPATVKVGGLLAGLRAAVCADCGRVTLRAENALDVFLAHRDAAAGREPGQAGPPAANIQCPSCGSVMSAAATSCDVCGWS